jgi:DNA helicase-2/ATP-dependent DNA helicase PcrA
MVLAGPGSGKTAVITQRTQNLITEYEVDPSNILVITFTKAAAMEMKQRFLLLSGQNRTRVTFGTFHAVFFMVLKAAYHFESSNIISEEQKYQLMREIVSYHHLEYRDENEFLGNLIGEISKVKNERIALPNFYSSQCGEEVFRKIYTEYDRRLKGNRLIDFDDMLLYTYELFSERKDILSAWQNKYRYILIDEFQDINQLQFDIIRLMAAPENNLFVVGDDDQSIYRFRGSKPELMLHFPKVYPDCEHILLDTNYRSDGYIVETAKRLIAHNKDRFPKDIRAEKPAKQEVRVRSYESQRAENLAIIKDIQEKTKETADYSQFAVLFRTNTQPRLLSEQLMEYNIPFQMKDRMPNLYDHWIAKDILTYIRIALGSRKRADFLQIMNRPKRYIGRDSLCDPEIDFDEWIKMYDEQPWIAERIEHLWHDLKMLQHMSPYAAINYIRRGIGYDDYLKEYADYRSLNQDDLFEILEELQQTAKGYKSYDAWMAHIEEYVRNLKQMAEKLKENQNALTLATLHSSKGLEFEHVYLLDANEGIMPYKKAVLEPEIEEERRLFYVGMTRAKEHLTICYVASINDKSMEASRFLKEMQEEISV